jgi:hypothetical protein
MAKDGGAAGCGPTGVGHAWGIAPPELAGVASVTSAPVNDAPQVGHSGRESTMVVAQREHVVINDHRSLACIHAPTAYL